jgi:hypothetical protein
VNKAKILTVIAFSSVLFAGCKTVPYEGGVPFQDNALAEDLRRNLNSLYPPSLRAVHRCILTVRHVQLGLTGYLSTRAGDTRMVATNDFGNTLFEVHFADKTGASIVRNTVGLPRRFLKEAPLRDAEVIYHRRPSEEATLTRHKGNVIALVEKLDDGRIEEFHFDGDTHRLVRYVLFRKGRCLYEASFSSYEKMPEWPDSDIPRAIEIKDHAMNYELAIQVLKFHRELSQK